MREAATRARLRGRDGRREALDVVWSRHPALPATHVEDAVAEALGAPAMPRITICRVLSDLSATSGRRSSRSVRRVSALLSYLQSRSAGT